MPINWSDAYYDNRSPDWRKHAPACNCWRCVEGKNKTRTTKRISTTNYAKVQKNNQNQWNSAYRYKVTPTYKVIRRRKPFSFVPIIWILIIGSITLAFLNIYPFSVPKDYIIELFTPTQEAITQKADIPFSTGTQTPVTTWKNPFETIDPNANLKDPSWKELKKFLGTDKTDQLPYIYPTFVCDNFARTLQTNARKAGWRCALVQIKLSGYPDWYHYGIPSNTGHACNAFQTTDKGIIYVDCTRSAGLGPTNQDHTVNVKVGNRYIPYAIFPDPGWHDASGDMGLIVGIESVEW